MQDLLFLFEIGKRSKDIKIKKKKNEKEQFLMDLIKR